MHGTPSGTHAAAAAGGSRAERLIAGCEGVDAVVILNDSGPFLDSTFWYLTEQASGSFEGSAAVVTADGGLHVLTGSLEAETARTGQGEVHVHGTRAERDAVFKDLLDGARRIGVNFHGITYASVQYLRRVLGDVELVDVGKGISATVSIKDDKELASIRRACAISSRVAAEIPDMLREGMTEKEAATFIDGRQRELGGEGNSFDTIAAFGENASMPHHSPGDRRLREGDVALFDFGTKYERYCSDLTRTVFFGEPDDELRRAYEVVMRAQEAGFAEYRDGAPAAAADRAARDIIDGSEFAGRFIHTFGHGIGMDVHQDISVYHGSEQTLRSGNVVSAEPGIYLPGKGGIRIEDTCLVTADGAERLTGFPRGITVVRP